MSARRIKIILCFSAALILAAAASVLFILKDTENYTDIQIINKDITEKGLEYEFRDYSKLITFKNNPVSADYLNATVYISENISEETDISELIGNFRLKKGKCSFCFVKDEYYNRLTDAVKESHAYKLVIVNSQNKYMEYRLIFTDLPVIELNGEVSGKNEKNRDIFSGNFRIYNPKGVSEGEYGVKNINAQWSVRGQTSAMQDKKPWKICFKTDKNGKKNEELLDLGKDDDWILNPLNLDDTKVKEALFMDLWNDMCRKDKYNLPMSRGRYVEVISNGEYCGLYMLQRRIDKKFLGLDENDVLLKGKPIWEAPSVDDGYEILYSKLDENEVYSLLWGIWSQLDYSNVDIENFTDVNLFLEYACAIDNVGYKNTFYVLKPHDGGYRLTMVPWDTDMSFGVIFHEGFVYDYEKSLEMLVSRRELFSMKKLIPGLEKQMAIRWQELRKDILTVENIHKVIENVRNEWASSGAIVRDEEKWGLYYYGDDTIDSLNSYVADRLEFMDKHYSKKLNSKK